MLELPQIIEFCNSLKDNCIYDHQTLYFELFTLKLFLMTVKSEKKFNIY